MYERDAFPPARARKGEKKMIFITKNNNNNNQR